MKVLRTRYEVPNSRVPGVVTVLLILSATFSPILALFTQMQPYLMFDAALTIHVPTTDSISCNLLASGLQVVQCFGLAVCLQRV
jgi:hypothetical protein